VSEPDARLEQWLEALLATPGLTAIRDPEEARRVHVEGSLAGLEHVQRFPGPLVDVGSGGGSPGFPLAAALPDRQIVLLESSERKCRFLERVARQFPNVRVVRGRAEEQQVDVFGVAVGRALARPPVAAEWCLPLVAPSGAAILYVGASVSAAAVGRVAERVGGGQPEIHPGLIVIPKLGPTPPGFPRRVGVARKRPIG
jgi:16S rRNA (guanine527-N7)-methyltransferase